MQTDTQTLIEQITGLLKGNAKYIFTPEHHSFLNSLLQQKKEIEVSDEWACDIYKESIGYDSYDTTGIFLAGCAHVRSQLSAESFTKEDMLAAFRQGIDCENGDSNVSFDRWLPQYAAERNISLSAKDKEKDELLFAKYIIEQLGLAVKRFLPQIEKEKGKLTANVFEVIFRELKNLPIEELHKNFKEGFPTL